MNRTELTQYLDEYLRIHEIEDRSDNGLQVAGPENITHVAFAVDACQASFEAAVTAGAHMLIVHHGLFWGQVKRLVGIHYRRVKTLLDGGVALYAAHLPLDAHPEVGNNAQLARLLDLSPTPFGDYHGVTIGMTATLPTPLPLAEFVARVTDRLGPPLRVYDLGPPQVRRIALISGGAMSLLPQVAEAGCDTFLTGETSHTFYHDTREHSLNVICAGHYATETVGLKALMRHLQDKFDLETVFLDLPTGL